MAFRFSARTFELADRGPLDTALARLRTHRSLALLDSASGEPRRFSVLAFDPLPVAVERVAKFAELRELWRELELFPGDDVPGFFAGGMIAALAYDLGVDGERALRVAPEPWRFPLVLGGLYVDFLVRDEARERTWLVLGHEPGDDRAPVDDRRRAIERELALEPELARVRLRGELTRSTSSTEHRSRIERCREKIAAGDLYQANLAHRLTAELDGDPLELYRRLRRANPAPYMGFVAWDVASERRGALLSSSPELLFEFDGRTARTRPIKGTIARSNDPLEDQRRRDALLASEKDRAELVMIVDLERNDLGRCAKPGGVRVEGLPTLASYARVHHLMADVVAELCDGVDAFDVLAALFPGGSISGCPKLRAMELIAELEGEGRGFFSGSLGCVDLRGRASFNILIRSLLWRPKGAHGEISFRVGGGITWSSDAASEDRETLDKAAGIVDALVTT